MSQSIIIKKVIKGFLVGVIATAVGAVAWIIARSDTDIISTVKMAYGLRKLGAILTAGALLNIVAFLLFLKQRKDYEAKGLMIAVFLVAIFGMIQKFG